MLYAVKCYWPGVSVRELERVAALAAQCERRSPRNAVAYLGALLFADDELVLCLFEGPSRATVEHASERAGIPGERLIRSIWLAPDRHAPT